MVFVLFYKLHSMDPYSSLPITVFPVPMKDVFSLLSHIVKSLMKRFNNLLRLSQSLSLKDLIGDHREADQRQCN